MRGHLSVWNVTLTTRAPLFIGSGKSYNKKEYIFDPRSKKVSIIDEEKMFAALARRGLIDAYEHYMFNRPMTRLWEFFRECGFTREETSEMTLYEANAADALGQDKQLAEIWQFMRDARQRPYVPGSSLKGALRTAILMKMIKQKKVLMDENSKGRSIEPEYLNILKLNKKNGKDEANSVMRGLSVSDSEPIDHEHMILARKYDISVGGIKKPINTIRESARPDIAISFRLTLDGSVKSGVDEGFIREAVAEYGEYYSRTYMPAFRLQGSEYVKESFKDCLAIGGGSGYFGKNIVYPMLGNDAGLKWTAKLMQRKFRNHRHEKDIEKGISPHSMKYTVYNGLNYHFGVCAFRMEETE